MDIANSLAPRSDQVNADDLVAGPMTVTIRKVVGGKAEQPFDFLLEETDRAYRPAVTMRRLIARANGLDVDEFLFICVETEPTLGGEYRVSVLELHEDAIAKGRDLMAEACQRWLVNGRAIDLPDYGDGRHVVDLPGWAYDNDFEDIQIGGAA